MHLIFTLFFIIYINFNFQLLKQAKAKTAKSHVEKVIAVSQKFAGFSYIIPEFEGQLFEHLQSIGARIYGPLAIIKSLKDTGKVPKIPRPLLALHFANFNITVTGLNNEERVGFIYNLLFITINFLAVDF